MQNQRLGKMSKILIVITTNFAPYSGLTTVMMNYYRAMDKTGLKIDFASTNCPSEDLLRELSNNGSQYFNLGNRKKLLISYLFKLRKVLKREKYDVIHVNGNSSTMLFELLTAQKSGVQVRIAHVHNTRTSYPILNKLLKNKFQKTYTCSIAVSSQAGDWLYGAGKYRILNNAINVQQYKFNQNIREEYRRTLGLENKFVVGHVGRLDIQKNHSFLLDIFAEIKKHEQNACLLLVGGGTLESELKEKSRRLGIEKDTIFVGMKNSASEYLQAMDVFVFPSLFEGLGIALIEAQASGLSCIASDVIPMETKMSTSVRYLSLELTPEKWCNVILDADVRSRSEISENACRDIRKAGYDIKTEASKLEKLYLNS